jgi:hypothetical protein
MTSLKPTSHARRSRRVRSRLTRVLALAVAGPFIMGSLAYAAGVGPVRRHVNEFLKGTAKLFHKAESSTGDFHVSPNPVGRGVLVIPMDDRGPRPDSESGPERDPSQPKEGKASRSHGHKQKTEPATALAPKDDKSNSASGGWKATKEPVNVDESKESDPDLDRARGARSHRSTLG